MELIQCSNVHFCGDINISSLGRKKHLIESKQLPADPLLVSFSWSKGPGPSSLWRQHNKMTSGVCLSILPGLCGTSPPATPKTLSKCGPVLLTGVIVDCQQLIAQILLVPVVPTSWLLSSSYHQAAISRSFLELYPEGNPGLQLLINLTNVY